MFILMKPFIKYVKKFSGRQKTNLNTLFRLGGFHIAKNFLGVIGKRMDGSGFSEILEDTSSNGLTKFKGNV